MNTLIYAYGNPGRMDDGLGSELVNALEKWVRENHKENIEFDCNYQLNIEDAYEISTKDLVIFVDASKEDIQDFVLTKVDENSKMSFTSHEASPGYIYYLSKKLFDRSPETFLLHIKGYKWDFKQGLSNGAKHNLHKTIAYMKIILTEPEKILKLKHNIIQN
jgi:hydrogenase maturation protease